MEETQSKQILTLEDLSIINEKINLQENILILLEKEVRILANEQLVLETELSTIQSQLQFLKKNIVF